MSPSDRQIIDRLRRKARRIAAEFNLKLTRVDEMNSRSKNAGVCFAGGLILIRLHRRNTRRHLSSRWLLDTLCHELAHLRHLNHGLKFRDLYHEILGHARRTTAIVSDAARATPIGSTPSVARRRGRARRRRHS